MNLKKYILLIISGIFMVGQAQGANIYSFGAMPQTPDLLHPEDFMDILNALPEAMQAALIKNYPYNNLIQTHPSLLNTLLQLATPPRVISVAAIGVAAFAWNYPLQASDILQSTKRGLNSVADGAKTAITTTKNFISASYSMLKTGIDSAVNKTKQLYQASVPHGTRAIDFVKNHQKLSLASAAICTMLMAYRSPAVSTMIKSGINNTSLWLSSMKEAGKGIASGLFNTGHKKFVEREHIIRLGLVQCTRPILAYCIAYTVINNMWKLLGKDDYKDCHPTPAPQNQQQPQTRDWKKFMEEYGKILPRTAHHLGALILAPYVDEYMLRPFLAAGFNQWPNTAQDLLRRCQEFNVWLNPNIQTDLSS